MTDPFQPPTVPKPPPSLVSAPTGPRRLLVPDAPALVPGARQAVWLSPDGEVEIIDKAEAVRRVLRQPHLLCHARATARRLGTDKLIQGYDLLELYAFVRPATFCLPTPRGLAQALDLPRPADAEAEALTLVRAAEALLRELMGPVDDQRSDPVGLAWAMGAEGDGGASGGGWLWSPLVLAALGAPAGPEKSRWRGGAIRAYQVWAGMKEWQADAPEPPPGHLPVEPAEARRRLADLVMSGSQAEPRPQQSDYASAVSTAFTPRDVEGEPNLVLAEAGTGVGKTLGYLAPATVWAEKNKGPVWISTYTRQLQHQIDKEMDRLHRDPATKARKVVIRKGRENYLCLLNLEEAAGVATANPQYAVAIGLMARWAAATRDGDMQGGDFPGWLVDLLGKGRTLALADRRGECVYSACSHYTKCFIEKSVRRARRADIVIANHALVMIQAALGGGDDAYIPTRYVFDEGHHVFDAADNAFAGHLTGFETAELRRWLLGAESGGRSRARGLRRRVEDLIGGDDHASRLLDEIARAARQLPGEAWPQRVGGGEPVGPTEAFLAQVRAQVYARAHGPDNPYSLEVEVQPLVDGVLEAAQALSAALGELSAPLEALADRLRERLDDESDELESDTRRRIDAIARSLKRRSANEIGGWRQMLAALAEETPSRYVDWFGVERQDGRDLDVGMYRHWVDPTWPLAQILGAQAHGLVMTSATLTDGTGDVEADWQAAHARTGAIHLPRPALRAQVPSPFDYASQTRVLIVNDVRKDDLAQVAAAYRELFLASGGGAIGLFTAVQRLRAVHERIGAPLEAAGLPLLSQHLDGLDVATLVDIFRGEDNACLLGTDAVRDGVDVPGRSLRLIVFDRVPWPRPDILHKARRDYFDRTARRRHYDDMITRLRLRQAFGRLVRRADDTGVFVLLDPMMPSRLKGAFPGGVEPQRVGLAEAVRITRDFLHAPAQYAPGQGPDLTLPPLTKPPPSRLSSPPDDPWGDEPFHLQGFDLD
ncbi:ATP-dependent DNA helicase [Nitrospirillum viridazoti]|uniref:Helicase n=1 Tax=Nitrospirillum viridazoti CBAmc TaxID=1441467 RepID=A0A248JLK2_9PROT|nr:ATP-dependent DNA helicase [Nitrospirillum amazonense]ASG19539.1 helicase [Nitrospirillum amazonense CBAmc]TWB26479.1 ATP-dependent DNA helicase DinG [Nitrospirillum amazonense]